MKRIRLTESDLHRIVKESVKNTLNELSLSKLMGAQSKAHNDMKNYGMAKIYGNADHCDTGWEPSKSFHNAIGADSKRNYAKMMQDKRGSQYDNFSSEIKRRKERLHSLPYRYQADFENAIDCLYYGEGYKEWASRAEDHMSPQDAKDLWKIATQFMSQDEENDWKRWIRQDWIRGDVFNSKNPGIDFYDF